MDCCRAPYNGRRGTLPGVQAPCNERCFGLAVVFAALLAFPCLRLLAANADVAASARTLPAEHERLIGYTGNVLGFGAVAGWLPDQDLVIVLLTNVGAMHAGESAYYPETLLKETQVIATARALARELEPKGAPAAHASLERR